MRILDNGVLHVIYSDGIVLEIEDIKELQVQFDLLDPKPRKVLQHLGRYSTMSSDCKKYAAEHFRNNPPKNTVCIRYQWKLYLRKRVCRHSKLFRKTNRL